MQCSALSISICICSGTTFMWSSGGDVRGSEKFNVNKAKKVSCAVSIVQSRISWFRHSFSQP